MTEREPKTQIFAENRRFSQIHVFSWKFQHLEGAGNRRKPQIFAENRRFLQKTAGNRRLGSVTLGASPLARPYQFYKKTPKLYSHPNHVSMFLIFPHLCLFCPSLSFFLCVFTSQSLNCTHLLRCAAKWRKDLNQR